jgi:hypothetical protein
MAALRLFLVTASLHLVLAYPAGLENVALAELPQGYALINASSDTEGDSQRVHHNELTRRQTFNPNCPILTWGVPFRRLLQHWRLLLWDSLLRDRVPLHVYIGRTDMVPALWRHRTMCKLVCLYTS